MTTKKKLVEIFPKPAWIEEFKMPEGMGGSDGGCACSAAGAKAPSLAEAIDALQLAHPDDVELKIADYSSERSRSEAFAALNRAFEASNQSLRVNEDNLDMVMTQAAPIIAVDGTIVFLGTVPSADQVEKALDQGAPVTASRSCC